MDAREPPGRVSRVDVTALVVVAVLVLVAVLVGRRTSNLVLQGAAPLTGPLRHGLPGPRYLIPVAVAALAVWQLPRVARAWSFGRLLGLAFVGSAVWALALAVTDGAFGIVGRLDTRFEYLPSVARVGSDPVTFLRTFADHIVERNDGSSWATHVAGHPPGALLFFWSLAEAGLGGRVWASLAVVLVGASSGAAVLVACRAVADEGCARLALPFAVLTPAAIWVATSADALFLGTSAWGVAMLALAGRPATSDRAAWAHGAAGGFLLGTSLYQSYGMAPLGLVAVGAALAHRRWWVLAPAAGGVLLVVAAYTAAGFWWLTGLTDTHTRYYQGVASDRPTSYFVWANLAALAIAVGPAVVVALVRLGRRAVRDRTGPSRVGLLALASAASLLVADLSLLSKGEVERIWLPYLPYLTLSAVLLAGRGRADRRWLAAQAATALIVQAVVVGKW